MDLRWSDCTGDTFALCNHQLLIDLLREHRPHWTEGQEFRILNTIRDFANPSQPYIMRMSCQQTLPNPNIYCRDSLSWKMTDWLRASCCFNFGFDLLLLISCPYVFVSLNLA